MSVTGAINIPFGRPGIGTAQVAQRRNDSRNGALDYYPAGGAISGALSRDPTNSAYSVLALQAGLLMGKVGSGVTFPSTVVAGRYAPSIIGLSGGALANGGTTLTTSLAIGTEIIRRIGSSGTFKLTGPPTAAGTVRTSTITFSAVNATTGDVTITAPNANEVQTLTFGAAATGGTMRLRVPLANGTMVTTDAITWNATDATWLAAINTALDAATGVAGGIVATGATPDTILIFTFSGTGYAGLPQPSTLISVITFPTSATMATVVQTTVGVDGRFVTSSLIQPTDGSETPITMIGDGYGVVIPDTSADVDYPLIPIAGTIDPAQIINWPADASLKAYIEAKLKLVGLWVFGTDF